MTRLTIIFSAGLSAVVLGSGAAMGALTTEPERAQGHALLRGGRLPVVAQSTECVGGYRIIGGVRSQGRTTGGVIVRCRS